MKLEPAGGGVNHRPANRLEDGRLDEARRARFGVRSAALALFPSLLAALLGALGVSLGSGVSPSWAADESVKDITFNDIKLNLKKDDPWDPALLTPAVKKLDGKQVRIRGYIFPTFQQTGLKQFVLMRDNMECCFGPGSVLHDRILVDMVGDATADYTVRPVATSGCFKVHEENGPDGETMAIYHLDCSAVK